MKTLMIVTVFAPLLGFAAGNTPEERTVNLSPKTIETAKAANKLILVASRGANVPAIFGNEHVAKFVESHFVVERQSKGSGRGSYLIYNHDGELIHEVANDPYPYELAVKIKRALQPETQYYTLLSRFNAGERGADLLENLIVGATDADDAKNAPRLMQAYLESLPAEASDAQLRFLAKHTSRSSDPGFAVLLEKGAHLEKLAELIFQEEFTPHLQDREVDAMKIAERVKDRYPHRALAQPIDRMAVELLEMREDWAALETVLPAYLDTYRTQLSPEMIGYYQWLSDTHLTNHQ